jgi:hypothetical protein
VPSAKWDYFPLLPTEKSPFVNVSAPFYHCMPSWSQQRQAGCPYSHQQQSTGAKSKSMILKSPSFYQLAYGHTAGNGRLLDPGLCDFLFPPSPPVLHRQEMICPKSFVPSSFHSSPVLPVSSAFPWCHS